MIKEDVFFSAFVVTAVRLDIFLSQLWLNSYSHPPDKMAVSSQTIFSYACSWMKSSVFFIKISLPEVCFKGPVDNYPAALVQMA